MEHDIINPIRNEYSEESDMEDAVATAPISEKVQEKVKFEKQPSLLQQVSTALGLTLSYRPFHESFSKPQRKRAVLSKRLSHQNGNTENESLVAEAHPSADKEDQDNIEVAATTKEPHVRRATTLMEHIAARSKSFVVFIITSAGVDKECLQTQDLLLRIHKHNKDNKLEDTATGAVRVRDIRRFLSAGRSNPSIISRRNCLLVSLPYVKIIILHLCAWLIPIGCNNFPRDVARYEQTELRCELLQSAALFAMKDNSESSYGQCRPLSEQFSSATGLQRLPFVPGPSEEALTEIDTTILEKLQQLMQAQSKTPFEYLALETALVESSDVLKRHIRIVRYTAFSICTAVRSGFGVTAAVLLRINNLRKIMNTLQQEVDGMVNSLNEVLGDDEMLSRAAVSELWDEPQLWEGGKYSATTRETRRRRLKLEAEMLLECYSQEGDVMLKDVRRINEYIDDSLSMVELHLAMQRNFLLKADVWMTTLATVISFFALIPGCFGMNIRHGLETISSSTIIFWSITIAIFFSTVLTGIIVCFFLKRLTI